MEMKTCRVRQDENFRVIGFETQIDSVIEHYWTRVLGNQHTNKFMVHDVL